MAEDLDVVVEDDVETIRIDPVTGTIETDQPDGSVIVNLDAKGQDDGDDDGDDWFRNLVDDIGTLELGVFANELVEGIKADDSSRGTWLENTSRGMDLLGIKLEAPKGEASGELQISSVTNPLLLEAILKGWANAQAEMLPAAGPVKVTNDGSEDVGEDQLSEALARGFNTYLTKVDKNYYPDTSHMLLWGTYFKGCGFKKIYRCPIRRRPVSDSVDAKDLIVSDTNKDFSTCGRITHKITMLPSVFKRMVLAKAYRDIGAQIQSTPSTTPVDEKIAGIQGTTSSPSRLEDQPYTIWETQCELDIDKFIPAGSKFKGEGVPLPYLVCIEKESEQILSIRRDWDEDDEECRRLRLYVKYPYIPGPGFYGTGMLAMLGNSTAAMTTAWREALDTAMFANFPGGLIAKLAGRQNTSNIRLSPGEFQPVETNGMPIDQVVKPLPYKDVTPGLLGMMDKIIEQSKALAQSIEIPVGEGVQNIPVGTMVAMIEQATKVMAAAHKGLHTAQSEELQMLADLFRRNPEDFWRLNEDKKQRDFWDEQKFLMALDNCTLTPVSDPNVPSHVHRVMKATVLVQLKDLFPNMLNPLEILKRCLAVINEDPKGLLVENPQTVDTPPDLKGLAALKGVEIKAGDLQLKQQKLQQDAAMASRKADHDQRMQASEEFQRQQDIAKEIIIHDQDDEKVAVAEERNRIQAEKTLALKEREIALKDRDLNIKEQQAGVAAAAGMRQHQLDIGKQALEADRAAHEAAMDVHTVLHPPKPAAAKKPKAKK